jgi:hypothetical protein
VTLPGGDHITAPASGAVAAPGVERARDNAPAGVGTAVRNFGDPTAQRHTADTSVHELAGPDLFTPDVSGTDPLKPSRTAATKSKPRPSSSTAEANNAGLTSFYSVQGTEFDHPVEGHSTLPGIPDRTLIPRSTYESANGHIIPFDPTFMFQPDAYRETAAGTVLEQMYQREASTDPVLRKQVHFEGYMNAQTFNQRITRPIAPEDIAYMKQQGYRIVEFGRFCFEDVVAALQVYRAHYGDVNVPGDYVISDAELRRMQQRSEQHEDMGLDTGRAGGEEWENLIGPTAGYDSTDQVCVMMFAVSLHRLCVLTGGMGASQSAHQFISDSELPRNELYNAHRAHVVVCNCCCYLCSCFS